MCAATSGSDQGVDRSASDGIGYAQRWSYGTVVATKVAELVAFAPDYEQADVGLRT
jgi:hypothetical protein